MKKILITSLAILSFNFAYCADISINTLPSGQKVIIQEQHDNNIVKIDTWINTGSINEDEKTTGISHFLEHLFFKGTQKYPTGEMDKILDSKGAYVNAGTSKDFTHYYIQIPSKDFDIALELHADMLLNPMIPRKELERERPVVVEEISKGKDNPTNVMFNNLYKLIYSKSNHPYARPVIGTKEVIENVTREEILDYYKKFYTPDMMTTVVVGDIETQDVIKKIEEAFKNEKKSAHKIKYPKIKSLEKIERIEEEMDINKTYYMLSFLAPKFAQNKDNYALDILSTILSDGKSSILNQELKEKKELVLSITSGNYSQKESGMFYIYAQLDSKKEQFIEKEIISEIKKIQKGDFSPALIEKAKNIIKTDTYYARESISNITEELGYDFTFSSDLNYYENYLKNIEKVQKQDIINVAKKYLLTNKYAVSVVKPKGFKNINEVTPKKTFENKLIEEKNNTKKYFLENGANVIIKPKNTNSIIAFDISIKGVKMIEQKPTSAYLTALCMTCGSEKYTNSEFSEFLDENGIKLSVTSSADIFTISLQATKNHLDDAFIALDEVLNKQIFPSYEIEKIKTRKIKELNALKDNPSSYVFDEFKKLAFLNSIYGQNSEFILKNIKNVSRDDILKYYNEIINPQNMVLSIVGDVDESFVLNKINEIVKSKQNLKKFSFKDYKYNQYLPIQNIEKTLYKNEVLANWIALGYKTCAITNRRDIATLNIINAILGDGMSSRLFTKLREEMGLAYSVGSTLNANIYDGAFIAYIGTNEKGIEQAKQEILAQFDTLKKEMVTTKELNSAKDKILAKLLMSQETNMSQAELQSWYWALGLGLEAFDDYKKLILDINQNDIIEIANKYFSNPYVYVVVKEKK